MLIDEDVREDECRWLNLYTKPMCRCMIIPLFAVSVFSHGDSEKLVRVPANDEYTVSAGRPSHSWNNEAPCLFLSAACTLCLTSPPCRKLDSFKHIL